MDNNNLDEENILKNSGETTDVAPETVDGEDEVENEDVETLREELNKLKSAYENQKKRAEKAEAEAKKKTDASPAPVYTKSNDLSAIDIIAVTKAGIDEDVLPEVLDYAKFRKITVAEAIKDPIIKATIAQRNEEKKTAEATHTGNARRSSSKLSDDALLANARNGQLPDNDADLERLLMLRRRR